MSVEPRLQLGIGRLIAGAGILDQEFELLAHAAPNDGVVGVEPHRDGFAVGDFLRHEIVDQPSSSTRLGARPASRMKLSTSWLTWPCEMTIVADRALVRSVNQAVGGEQREPDGEEMHQRLADARVRTRESPLRRSLHACPSRPGHQLAFVGTNQIGEV